MIQNQNKTINSYLSSLYNSKNNKRN